MFIHEEAQLSFQCTFRRPAKHWMSLCHCQAVIKNEALLDPAKIKTLLVKKKKGPSVLNKPKASVLPNSPLGSSSGAWEGHDREHNGPSSTEAKEECFPSFQGCKSSVTLSSHLVSAGVIKGSICSSHRVSYLWCLLYADTHTITEHGCSFLKLCSKQKLMSVSFWKGSQRIHILTLTIT